MQKRHRDLFLLFAGVGLGLALGNHFLRGRGEDPRHDVPDDVALCKQRQRALYRGLVALAQDEGGLPGGTGAELLARLVDEGRLEGGAEALQCTGAGAGDAPPGFVLRDRDAAPLEAFPMGGDEPLLACDQAGGDNHPGTLNVLYADGSVRTFVLTRLLERGQVPAGTETLTLGPDSPVAALRVFPE